MLAGSLTIFGVFLLVIVALNISRNHQPDESSYIRFHAKNLFPESFDWDVKHSRFILGSMATGSLYTLSESGKLEVFIEDRDYSGKYMVLGVKVDGPRNRVVALVHNPDHRTPLYNALVAYDLDSKERRFLARLEGTSSDSRPTANDVAVDVDGNLYVTNARGNFIWKVSQDGKDVSVFTEDKLFSSLPVTTEDELAKPCNLNGIVYHPDKYLLVGQSNTGALFKVNLRGEVSLVGKKADLEGADGIALRENGELVVVSSSKAWLMRSNDHWRSAHVADELALNRTEFATAVAVRDGLKTYVLYSRLLDHVQGLTRREFSVQHVEFPKAVDDPAGLIVLIVVFVVIVLGWRFQMGMVFDKFKEKMY